MKQLETIREVDDYLELLSAALTNNSKNSSEDKQLKVINAQRRIIQHCQKLLTNLLEGSKSNELENSPSNRPKREQIEFSNSDLMENDYLFSNSKISSRIRMSPVSKLDSDIEKSLNEVSRNNINQNIKEF